MWHSVSLCWNTPSLLWLWGQTCYLSSPSPISYSSVLLVLRLPLPSPRAIIPCDLWPTLFPQGIKPSVIGSLCWKCAEPHSAIFFLNNLAMNLLLLFYKITAVDKGFEDHPAFCNIYPWGWDRVLANLGPYNLPNCSLDFIFDILNLGLNSKFQETRPKDLEGQFLNYQRSLLWGNLFPFTLSPHVSQYPHDSNLVPHREPQSFPSKCKIWHSTVSQVTATHEIFIKSSEALSRMIDSVPRGKRRMV